jgi:two-component system, NtrC family, sensor histidine kinase HydH
VDAHGVVTVIACAGHLAFGILAFLRRSRSPLGGLMACLFLDAFLWNFAGLAHELTGSPLWKHVDHFFSTMMSAIALHVVVTFVGRSRRYQPLIIGAYLVFATLALLSAASFWWKALAVLGPGTMLLAAALLVAHRRRTLDPDERARTLLLLLAISIGTLLGATDLLHGETSLPIPRLGAVGTLLAMSLIAVAALRLRLLGLEVPPALALYALLLAAFWVVAHLALSRFLDARYSPWVLGASALVIVAVASVRELGRSAALGRLRHGELATLGRFSEQLAHDLKNPLAALKGAVEFLQGEHQAGRSLNEQSRFLGLMLNQIERARRIVGDYQRIAKVEPKFSRLSLNVLVEEGLSLQRFGMVQGVSVLPPELDPALPACPLDRDLVITAFENLLRNACEALPNGGSIAVRTAYDVEADTVSLTVQDHGQGMSAIELEQAAQLFFTTKAQGTGLGLSFADRVAKAHGGELKLASVLGQGTTVSMTFRVSRGGTA